VDAEEGGRRRAGRREFLEDQRRVQSRQAQAAGGLGGVQAAEAQFAGMPQCVAREDGPRVPLGRMRRHLVAGEIARRLLERALLLVEFEVHGGVRLNPG